MGGTYFTFHFSHPFYVTRDLCAAHLALGLPWLDDKQVSLQFGTTRVFYSD
jgi:hypothetical protein